jgi:predicted dehydrogenase
MFRSRQQPITFALLGAGQRGAEVYAEYLHAHPKEAQLVAAADPDPERLERVRLRHGLKKTQLFRDWRKLLDKPKLADALIVATPDPLHLAPALRGLELGYHVLLEKPIATREEDLDKLAEAAAASEATVTVAHVLRYTPFFSKIKELLESGRIGKLMSVIHLENIGYWHFAHSYVRGNWRNLEVGAPLVLAKACHDLDLLRWLVGAPCTRLSSFGELGYFTPEHAPEGAADYCLDCPVERNCAFSAVRFYVEEQRDNHGWPVSVISKDTSLEGRIEALRDGPYGRCVYKSDNDIADHQVLALEFENGVLATLTISAFTKENTRTLKLMGSKGEIRGHLEKGEIELRDFVSGEETLIRVATGKGHAGGDVGLMNAFVRFLASAKRGDGSEAPLTSLAASLDSHRMAFAAEEARLEGKVVALR